MHPNQNRIQLLPSLLANQIAAGEVVERPASVLKELLENSLDAQSTQIDIAIEKGGLRSIEVSDNGVGICKEDLALALHPHATSKITQLADLEGVASFGFRGEALASISSISELELCSWVPPQEWGWCIKAEGRDSLPVLKPIPKRPGTFIAVRNLFFNTPARRKFMRSEKTEFLYLEEIFKRIALSAPTIGFKFQKDDGPQKRFPPCLTFEACCKRVGALCGQQFLENAYYIEAASNGITLKGWLGSQQGLRAQADVQYFYVNGRSIRDKVVMHAIRQAYQDLCVPGRHPAYVLYLDLDPTAVDVNVHPTKHEVRFREARTVHAFITYAIEEGLKSGSVKPQEALPLSLSQPSPKKEFTDQSWDRGLSPPASKKIIEKPTFKKMYSFFEGAFLWIEQAAEGRLLDIDGLRSLQIKTALEQALEAEGVSKKPLLMPISIIVAEGTALFEQKDIRWDALGFEISIGGAHLLLVRSIPTLLKLEPDQLKAFLCELINEASEKEIILSLTEGIVKKQRLSESEIKDWYGELEPRLLREEKTYKPFIQTLSLEQFRKKLF